MADVPAAASPPSGPGGRPVCSSASGAPPDLQPIWDALAKANATIQQLTGAAVAPAQAACGNAAAAAGDCCGASCDCIQAATDKATATLDKLLGRLTDVVQKLIDSIFANASPLGVHPQPPSVIQHDAAQGYPIDRCSTLIAPLPDGGFTVIGPILGNAPPIPPFVPQPAAPPVRPPAPPPAAIQNPQPPPLPPLVGNVDNDLSNVTIVDARTINTVYQALSMLGIQAPNVPPPLGGTVGTLQPSTPGSFGPGHAVPNAPTPPAAPAPTGTVQTTPPPGSAPVPATAQPTPPVGVFSDQHRSGPATTVLLGAAANFNNDKPCESLTATFNVNTTAQQIAAAGAGKTTAFGLDDLLVNAWEAAFPSQQGKADAVVRYAVDAVRKYLTDALGSIGGAGACSPGMGAPAMVAAWTLGFAERWLGLPRTGVQTALEQTVQAMCAQQAPTAPDTTGMYLANSISAETATCWFRANGVADVPAFINVESQRSRVGAADVVGLWRRGLMDSDSMYRELRSRGYLHANEAQQLIDATAAVPSPSEVTRMMVRDAADEDLVLKYKYDQDFTKKFTGQLKTWMNASGIDDNYAKFIWRSHWELPSYTQLKECMIRLRPGREGVQNPTTKKDVEDALIANDMAPWWVPRLMEIAYNPLTRTDAMRGYQIGVITDERLADVFRDEGYDEQAVKILVDFTKVQTNLRRRREAGLLTPRELVLAFSRGEIDEATMLAELLSIGYDLDRTRDVIRQAELKREVTNKRMRVKAIKKRLEKGEIEAADAKKELLNMGIDHDSVEAIVDASSALRSARGKELTAAQLCKAFTDGLMTKAEYSKRLQNIGYSKTDADVMAGTCDVQATPAKARPAKVAANRANLPK